MQVFKSQESYARGRAGQVIQAVVDANDVNIEIDETLDIFQHQVKILPVVEFDGVVPNQKVVKVFLPNFEQRVLRVPQLVFYAPRHRVELVDIQINFLVVFKLQLHFGAGLAFFRFFF